ncbi:MAG: hypothetical protein F6J93_07635 [Oscillatoria sp. SIO1A7]|nr:hypothetical protein [Oscillatoria sp. SIO1A7]
MKSAKSASSSLEQEKRARCFPRLYTPHPTPPTPGAGIKYGPTQNYHI